MTLFSSKRAIFISILCAAFIVPTAQAGQAQTAAQGQLNARLPVVDRAELVDTIRTVRSELIKYKQALLKAVADKQLDRGDAVITTLMPGGLLFAGYKKLRLQQAKKELARVKAEIDEYSSNLLDVQAGLAEVVVAQLH